MIFGMHFSCYENFFPRHWFDSSAGAEEGGRIQSSLDILGRRQRVAEPCALRTAVSGIVALCAVLGISPQYA